MDDSHREAYVIASGLYSEYLMVKGGAFSYQDLGYSTLEGAVPAGKVHEFKAMQAIDIATKPAPKKRKR